MQDQQTKQVWVELFGGPQDGHVLRLAETYDRLMLPEHGLEGPPTAAYELVVDGFGRAIVVNVTTVEGRSMLMRRFVWSP